MSGQIREPPWISAPPSEPTADVPEAVEVLVVGAGITGLTTALLLARAGVDVGVIDANDPAAGTTGRSTAKVSVLQGTRLHEIGRRHPDHVVRAYASAHDAARHFVAETCAELGVAYETRTAWTYATGASGSTAVRAEAEALTAAGLPAELTSETGLPYEVRLAVLLDGQGQIDPRAYSTALARAVRDAGGWIRSHARMIGATVRTPHRVTVSANGGRHSEVRPRRLVLATGTPVLDRGLFFARLRPQRSYGIAVTVRGLPPDGMYLSADSSTRSLRVGTQPRQLLVGGAGHDVGHGPPEDEHYAELEGWACQHFDVAEITHAWSAQDYASPDGLPYVGALLPTDSTTLVATGFGKWGITGGTAAAHALAGLVLGTGEPPLRWEPWRGRALSGAGEVVRLNAEVGASLASGWAAAALRTPDQRPAEGQGSVGRRGRHLVAISRVDGVVREVSAVCTHLRGVLRWNGAEKSWDCPLHGSRFGPDGQLLEGPATCGLALLGQ
jgi:glycine/D-amino acid oxidase-like deaminating enzyme/nitrite reductase/ring-hydroxylating ferredoxin subunit